MKNYLKLLFIGVGLFSINSLAQKSKSKKVKINPTSSKRVSVKDSDFKKKYLIENLNEEYDWFYGKNERHPNIKYGIIKKNGDVILPNLFNYQYGGGSYDKVLSIGDKYGVFNLVEKKWILPLEYKHIEVLNNKFYKVKKNGLYQVVDFNNKPINKYKWNSFKKVLGADNYAIVTVIKNNKKKEGVFSILEKKMVIPCKYERMKAVRFYRENVFLVYNRDANKYNFVSFNNKLFFKKWYKELKAIAINRFLAKKNGFYGIIDENEKIIVPFKYLTIYSSSKEHFYFAKTKDRKKGLITANGTVVLPLIYDNLYPESDYVMITNKGKKYGMVNLFYEKPKTILECTYDDINKTNNSLYTTKKDKKFGVVDSRGNILSEAIYDDIKIIRNNSGIIAKRKGEFLFLDKKRKQFKLKKYKDVSIIPASNEKASSVFFKVKEKNKYKIVDNFGENISDIEFDDIVLEDNNVFIVKSGGKYGVFSIIQNKMVLPFSYEVITKLKKSFLGINNNKIDVLKFRNGKILITKND